MSTRLFIVVACLFFAAETVQAQQFQPTTPPPEIGIRGGYDFEAQEFGLGAQAHISMLNRIKFVPSFDAMFGDDLHWQLNADLAGDFNMFYAGAGLGVAARDFTGDGEIETRLGPNLMAGIDLGALMPASPVRPFVEARYTFTPDIRPFRLHFGISYPLIVRVP
jgi:hypothetical protein